MCQFNFLFLPKLTFKKLLSCKVHLEVTTLNSNINLCMLHGSRLYFIQYMCKIQNSTISLYLYRNDLYTFCYNDKNTPLDSVYLHFIRTVYYCTLVHHILKINSTILY